MQMANYLKIADFFTLGNLFSGMLSVYCVVNGFLYAAALMLVLAVVFDVLDGKVAGLLHQKHDFGKQIDSMADLVSFGVAPVLCFFIIDSPTPLVLAPCLFFTACGMLRLARYNITDSRGFEGLPITVNGVIFATMLVYYAHQPAGVSWWPPLFLLQGVLMVAAFKVNRLF